jgi:hypothetical protein
MKKKKIVHDINWLLLIHQVPPKPDSFRVKIWRALQKTGALQLKNAVYVLPVSDVNQEKFQTVIKDIVVGKGEAFLCQSQFIQGIDNQEIIEQFNNDRSEKYKSLAIELRALQKDFFDKKQKLSENDLMSIEHSFGKLERILYELKDIDLFNCVEQEPTQKLFKNISSKIEDLRAGNTKKSIHKKDFHLYQGKTWVTRNNIHTDRLASAWLISGFIDKKPTFKFVKDNNYKIGKNEICFDMFEAEFTHVGDKCTFEVLAESFLLTKAPILIIAEIIHDLDLKDTKFNRLETPGIGMVLESIIASESDDFKRMEKTKDLFDNLYKTFKSSFKK